MPTFLEHTNRATELRNHFAYVADDANLRLPNEALSCYDVSGDLLEKAHLGKNKLFFAKQACFFADRAVIIADLACLKRDFAEVDHDYFIPNKKMTARSIRASINKLTRSLEEDISHEQLREELKNGRKKLDHLLNLPDSFFPFFTLLFAIISIVVTVWLAPSSVKYELSTMNDAINLTRFSDELSCKQLPDRTDIQLYLRDINQAYQN